MNIYITVDKLVLIQRYNDFVNVFDASLGVFSTRAIMHNIIAPLHNILFYILTSRL